MTTFIANTVEFINRYVPIEQFIKYCIVGAGGAVVNISVLYTAVSIFRIYYIFGAIISFICASIFNYSFDKIWTFKDKDIPVQYMKFVLASIVGITISITVLFIIVEFLNIWYLLAQIFAIASATIWNFTTSKKIVFKKGGK